MTTKSLATTRKISPTTCYRILPTFVAAGWLRPGANGTFELSFGLVPLFRPLLRHELLIENLFEPRRLRACDGAERFGVAPHYVLPGELQSDGLRRRGHRGISRIGSRSRIFATSKAKRRISRRRFMMPPDGHAHEAAGLRRNRFWWADPRRPRAVARRRGSVASGLRLPWPAFCHRLHEGYFGYGGYRAPLEWDH